MRYLPTHLYAQAFPELSELLQASIERGCSKADTTKPIELFFRADDIGVPSGIFTELITLFQRHQLPLCLAVVPSWLSKTRYTELRSITGRDDTLWCWHQHGRLHKNFEKEGKKQEFGPARDFTTLKHHIQLGKERLESLLGNSFQPFFTPPWNRCSRDTALALNELKFLGISRSHGARPDVSDILSDIQVNVDLHTRKEPDPHVSLNKLLDELEMSLASSRCGIMIHHQRMNSHAFVLLDLLMGHLVHRPDITPRLFSDMV
jgi:hypothetical protein